MQLNNKWFSSVLQYFHSTNCACVENRVFLTALVVVHVIFVAVLSNATTWFSILSSEFYPPYTLQ